MQFLIIMRLLAKYINGNYKVKIYDDGTKIKTTSSDFFDAEFPDSMDIKITNRCDMNCPMCHEQSTLDGIHGDLNAPFLDTLESGTELAIGGGNPLTHPDLVDFLKRMKSKNVICNITINEEHLLKNIDFVQHLLDQKLIYGLGVSINKQNPVTLDFAERNKNVVFHFIIGLVSPDNLSKLYNRNYKILLLGYKKFGRGVSFYSSEIDKNIKLIEDNVQDIFNSFFVVSFDNLALAQLSIKDKVPPHVFENAFMGDDGESTMYVDLVKREFGVSSTSTKRLPLTNDIRNMFDTVKNMAK